MPDRTTPLAYNQEGSGPVIVFVHGLTFSRATWRPITARLADRFQCISVDLPGHGETPGPPQPLDAVAHSLYDTLTALGIDRPVVVGHSMAVAIVSMYAAKYATAGVVNVDQPLNVGPFAEMVQRMAPALQGDGFDLAFEPIRQSMGVDALPAPMRSQVAATQTIRQDLVLGYWAELLAETPAELQRRIDAVADAIAVPYLAIMGQTLSDVDREHLRRHVRGAQIEEWPGRGHMVHLAEPDRFAERLAAFVRDCADL